jgi:O-methyltransferase
MKKFIKKIIHKLLNRLGYDISSRIDESVGKYWSGFPSNEIRLLFHYEMFMKTISLSGHIVECGVANGKTLGFFRNLQKEYNCSRKVWGFDSFEGFSPAVDEDGSRFANSQDTYNLSYQNYTIEYVRQNLVNLGAQNPGNTDISLIKGWIPQSFEFYDGSPVSLLNVDVDIYEPTKATLEFFWPLLQENGIILLDEYDFDRDAIKWPGAKKAVDEFCKAKNISVTKHYTGKSYITKT